MGNVSTCVKDPKTPYEYRSSDKWIEKLEQITPELMYQFRPQLEADARFVEEKIKKFHDVFYIREKDILRVSYLTIDKTTEWCVLDYNVRVAHLKKNIKIPFTVTPHVGYYTFNYIHNVPSLPFSA